MFICDIQYPCNKFSDLIVNSLCQLSVLAIKNSRFYRLFLFLYFYFVLFLSFLCSCASLTRPQFLGTKPYQDYHLSVTCFACTCTVLPIWQGGRHRRRLLTLQTPNATLIPLYPAQRTLATDILVCWIGKMLGHVQHERRNHITRPGATLILVFLFHF